MGQERGMHLPQHLNLVMVMPRHSWNDREGNVVSVND